MSIRQLFCGMLVIAAGLFYGVYAQTFDVVGVDSEYTVWRLASGEREEIAGNSVIGVGDTLFTPVGYDVRIRIESNSSLLVKGGSVVTLSGRGTEIDVTLCDGQVFLDRKQPHGLTALRILTKGHTVIPVGTAFAVKTAPQGIPTTAVLRGAAQMQSESGESVTVGARQFGTVNSEGTLVSGNLSERGILQLEAWSGVEAEERSAPAVIQVAMADNISDDTAQDAVSDYQPEIAAESAAAPADIDADESYEPAPQTAQTAESGRKAADASAPTPLFSRPAFELSVGMATVNGEPWTRLALGVDVPIWRFGVFLDLELFINADSELSDKGWNFKDDPADAIFRKIRYIRYGRETDPLFVKFGGLSNVTLGYGIIMDRFTNMLHYPSQKLLGLQFNLNDVTPYGITLQTLISDFAELSDDGGVLAARLAFAPLKSLGLPIISNFTIGGTYATDLNTLAPARKWRISGDDKILSEMRDKYEGDGTNVFEDYKNMYRRHTGRDPAAALRQVDIKDSLSAITSSFSLYGFDAGLPIIRTSLLGVDLYGQSAFRADTVKGWGIGAPGVAVKVWKLNGAVEYRRLSGEFTPGFFDAFYLDERYSRGLLKEKGQLLADVDLQGVFGRLGMDVFGFLSLSGSAQYMTGDKDGVDHIDRRYEATGGLGSTVLNFIPKISLAEVYIRNYNIGNDNNLKFNNDGRPTNEKAGLFDRTPFMHWGYRTGFELAPGTTLIWEYRYGWQIENGKLVPNNHMFLQTALRF